MVCTSAPYVVTTADAQRGSVDNLATARASVLGVRVSSAQASTKLAVTMAATTSLAATKAASLDDRNGNGFADAGEQVSYQFTVSNTGTTAIDQLRLDDPMFTGAAAPTCAVSTLAAGAATTCQAGPHTVTAQEVATGKVTNTAVAVGAAPDATEVRSPQTTTTTVTGPVPQSPTATLSLVKSVSLTDTNADGYANAGEKLTYSFAVANTGPVAVTGVAVSDSLLADADIAISCPKPELAPGEVEICTSAAYQVTAADVAAKKVSNVAQARAVNKASQAVVASASSSAVMAAAVAAPAQVPGMKLVKTAQLADTNGDGLANAGEKITYTFTATNTGTVALSGLSISDPMLERAGVTISCTPTSLAVGSSARCVSAPYQVTSSDLASSRNNVLRNSATATTTSPAGAASAAASADVKTGQTSSSTTKPPTSTTTTGSSTHTTSPTTSTATTGTHTRLPRTGTELLPYLVAAGLLLAVGAGLRWRPGRRRGRYRSE